MIGTFTLTHRRAALDVVLHRVCCFFDPFLNCRLEFASQFGPAVEVGHCNLQKSKKGVDSTFTVKPTPVVFSRRESYVMPLVVSPVRRVPLSLCSHYGYSHLVCLDEPCPSRHCGRSIPG